MRTYTVKMVWDNGYWHTKTDDDLGITLESESFDTLVERVCAAAPEMLELNCGYVGNVQLLFEAERIKELHVGLHT